MLTLSDVAENRVNLDWIVGSGEFSRVRLGEGSAAGNDASGILVGAAFDFVDIDIGSRAVEDNLIGGCGVLSVTNLGESVQLDRRGLANRLAIY